MWRLLIIEDEFYAAKRLEKLLTELVPQAEILAKLETIEETVSWLRQHRTADLVFMDIQLADGLSFDIFNRFDLQVPIIFTTAFNEYAIRAFKTNSIDYLLKPIDKKELQNALNKYQRLQIPYQGITNKLSTFLDSGLKENDYAERFIVKSGKTLQYVNTHSIRYFYSEDSISFVITENGKRWLIDHSMESIQNKLDPNHFFRINRKMIVHIQSIISIEPYFNNRLAIQLSPKFKEDVIVSRDKVKSFKNWLGS